MAPFGAIVLPLEPLFEAVARGGGWPRIMNSAKLVENETLCAISCCSCRRMTRRKLVGGTVMCFSVDR